MPTNPTPGQRYDGAMRLAGKAKKEGKRLAQRKQAFDRRVEELQDQALIAVNEGIGFSEEDVVIDDFGSMYRVTKISIPSFYWNEWREIPKFTKVLSRVRVEGVLLNKNGIPVWQKSRTVHGKLKKYQPTGEGA